MTTFIEIKELRLRLKAARKDYLELTGWKLLSNGRWWKEFPHGSQSTRRIEADTRDAVNFQAGFSDA